MEHSNERLINLIPQEVRIPSKPSRYVSQHRPRVKQEYKEIRDECRTFGVAEVDKPKPHDYLRKSTQSHQTQSPIGANATARDMKSRRTQSKSEGREVTTANQQCSGDAGPKRENKEKSWIARNIKEVKCMKTKSPQKKCVESKDGKVYELESSGLYPKFVYKKDFGAVPKYIKAKRKAETAYKTELERHIADTCKQSEIPRVTQDEKDTMIEELKGIWEELTSEYQSISLAVDSNNKKKHKERLETQLAAIERDIDLLQRHEIYVIPERN